ncbi:protease inhibitor I42 family protein [Methylocella silvestris]|nr:protease inhibitor I42 family protein [Methylocella silvestris]
MARARIKALIAACACAVLASGAALAQEAGRIADEADNGGTIRLHAGETITLRLPENPSTGYGWSLEPYDAELLDVRQGPYRARAGALGAGGEASWTIRARAAGSSTKKTTLGLKLWLQWEGDPSIVKRFGVTLPVAP